MTVSTYRTPRGFADLIMVSDGDALTGLWFEGSRNAPALRPEGGAREPPALRELVPGHACACHYPPCMTGKEA